MATRQKCKKRDDHNYRTVSIRRTGTKHGRNWAVAGFGDYFGENWVKYDDFDLYVEKRVCRKCGHKTTERGSCIVGSALSDKLRRAQRRALGKKRPDGGIVGGS